jgi:hypothetical protein
MHHDSCFVHQCSCSSSKVAAISYRPYGGRICNTIKFAVVEENHRWEISQWNYQQSKNFGNQKMINILNYQTVITKKKWGVFCPTQKMQYANILLHKSEWLFCSITHIYAINIVFKSHNFHTITKYITEIRNCFQNLFSFIEIVFLFSFLFSQLHFHICEFIYIMLNT